VKCDILYLAKGKRDYRALTPVIPTPTPEWPFDGLRTVPRGKAWGMMAQSRFLGKWEGRLS